MGYGNVITVHGTHTSHLSLFDYLQSGIKLVIKIIYLQKSKYMYGGERPNRPTYMRKRHLVLMHYWLKNIYLHLANVFN